jgi:hypothetical protein
MGRQQENRALRLFADIQIECETIMNLWNDIDLFVSVFNFVRISTGLLELSCDWSITKESGFTALRLAATDFGLPDRKK